MMFWTLLTICITLSTLHVEGHLKKLPGHIGAKLSEYLKTSAWKPLHTEAKIEGPLKLLLKYKYKLPVNADFMLEEHHSSCYSWMDSHVNLVDGVYTIYPDGSTPKKALCDMMTDGGGWTVFQKRKDGSVDFYRGWKDYKNGFGSASGEYWLGNEALHSMTKGRTCELRIDMENFKGTKGFAHYNSFRIYSEAKGYAIHVGKYTGTAGKDSLKWHNGKKFTTKDRDNDSSIKENCAVSHTGAWWFNVCSHSSMNGDYKVTNSDKGVEWDGFPGGKYMKSVKMMLRCKD